MVTVAKKLLTTEQIYIETNKRVANLQSAQQNRGKELENGEFSTYTIASKLMANINKFSIKNIEIEYLIKNS